MQEEVVILGETDIPVAFEALLAACEPLKPNERAGITAAFELARKAHVKDLRKSGEPYIFHPIAVAKIVAEEIGLGHTSVMCALLHDVVEDTSYTLEDIEKGFGKEVARITDGLTKIKGMFNKSKVLQKATNIKKILLTIGEDIRVILIKLADRLHNMRTMDSMKGHKQIQIAEETLYIFTPIAHRLGLYRIKSELEDLCFKYTNPVNYREIAKKLSDSKKMREAFIERFIGPVKDKLHEKGIENFEIYGRPKHIFSIYNKIQKKGVEFNGIYDLFAIRIIVDVPLEEEKAYCWRVYSYITDLFTPKPDRLRDWISHGKGNGYESLHTTVMGPEGKWVEVQIRTKRMDEIAEKGVAAHWKYKGGKTDHVFDDWLQNVREILQNRVDDNTPIDFVNDFRRELYENDMYIFTPKGDLRTLRAGSTVLDFAFSIHSEVGQTCKGAVINGKLFPISHKLKSGDQVEIKTGKNQKPSEAWLNIAVTSKARSKIKSILNAEKRKIADLGREMLERKLRGIKVSLTTQTVEDLVNYYKTNDSLDFFHKIATKKIDVNEVKKLKFDGDRLAQTKTRKIQSIGPNGYSYEGKSMREMDLSIFEGFADKVDYSIAKCCSPMAGDDVFGFITIGKGIRIHKLNCPNAADLQKRYPYRTVNIKWEKSGKEVMFLRRIRINGLDDIGLVNQITGVISFELKVNMRSIALNAKDGIFEGDIQVYVHSMKELKELVKRLEDMEDVYSVDVVG